MKVDHKKAYDIAQHGFAEEMLLDFKFPPKFIRRVMVHLQNTFFLY